MCESPCRSGSFGAQCRKTCSTTCKNGACTHTNGYCIGGCEAGYQGDMCERKCRAGKFGIRCQENCPLNCKNGICYHDNGDCSKGCNPGYRGNKCTERCQSGYYGDKCANQCHTNCKEGDTICRHTDGECLNGCQTGWNGKRCDSKCMLGKFGQGCEENCPLNCYDNECDFINGNCVEGCKPGFQGNKCKEKCTIGTFGDKCGNNCSGNCVGGDIMCRNIDGHCLNGCKTGWNGTNCFSECDIGSYGKNCSSVCGNCQLGNNCDHVTGTCHEGCKTGYSGATCLQAVQSSNSSGVIVGVVAVFAIIIMILIIAFILYKRHSQNKRKDEQSVDVELRDAVTTANSRSQGLRSYKGSRHAKTGDSANTAAGDENIYKNFPMNSPFRNAIPLSNLLPYVKENLANHDSFPKEFQEIPYGMKKASNVAKKSYNREKNRYKDMHAYDETRVMLKTLPKERGSDYINASFIKGHHKDRAYIAAQGPIDASVDDFWRMICEKEIFTIAMVTNLVEEGKTKCQQYWPAVQTRLRYGKTSVYTASEIIYSDFTIRNFNVSYEGGPQRNIRQFHFTSWPDKSVPRTTSCLLQFWRKVRKTDENKYHTWLVHCSAGVGRTGTFIALDILYDQGKDKGSVDVYQCVKDLRDQRVNMVQTKDQYVFLHNLMVEALLFFSEPIPLDKLHKAVKDLKTVDQATKKSKHLLLYEALKEDMTVLRTDKAVKEMNSAALLKDNRSKNRFSTVLAGNEFRPILVTHFSGRTNYINAVFMPSYCHKEGYYVTQKPLDNTAIDFCRLLYEKNVKVIVKFPDNEKDHVGVDMSVGPFMLKKKSEEDKVFYTKTVFNMAYKSKDIKITQLEFKNWDADQITPDDPENMLHFMHEVELLNRIAYDSPVLVQCLDGSEKSGLFVTLMNIFERAKLDNEVSIPQVIRELRYIRQQIIPNFEQFQFCYDAVLRYVDSHQMYANM
ncbi:receptor-type tyrosine-protein phosphatase alpha-like [Ruditapes philippinarum]|uniref:receptor-type tyrosine-protein phosphatase alpha-like n=1 Tax=Ruditapes philippinarum TaxID=129788 RepID=UPI00295C0D38|nr:receptor-type tyrosine-protein phosphatase alpha-like [Ruditapes philippinarum]